MQKSYVLILLMIGGFVNAQILNIPDANFKAALLSYSPAIDTNSDGNIEFAEAQAVTYLSISDRNIADLTGIQSFTNLTYLSCGSNVITTLDVSGMTNLTNIFAGGNPLTLINLTGLTQNISELNISGNQMTSLTINGGTFGIFDCSNSALVTLNVNGILCGSLNCDNSQLTALTITDSTLQELHCANNHLTSLDLSDVAVEYLLTCAENQITSLDLSNQNMTYLYCSTNLLTNLDVSHLTNLTFLACVENPLTFLNLKNGVPFNIDFQFLLNSPTLQYVCANEDDIPQILLNVNAATIVGSYCSFNPGGNYNTISGAVHYDSDNNGCGPTDIVPLHLRMNISDAINSGATTVNAASNYAFYTDSGNFTVTPVIQNPGFFTISPPVANINFAAGNLQQTQDFCIVANGVHDDVEIALVPVTPAINGEQWNYKIVYRNNGTRPVAQPLGITVNFNDTDLNFVSASVTPDAQPLGTLVWSYDNLQPFEVREIYFALEFDDTTLSPPPGVGGIVPMTAHIDLLSDENQGDNSFALQQVVVENVIPNGNTCLEGHTVNASLIGDYLHYNFYFENSGNETASNIVIKTIIDPENFDIGSLQIMETSNPVYTRITGDKVEFIFEGINLPPSGGNLVDPIGGHGNVLFKIKSNSSLQPGNHVSNQAAVYFNYDAPITTGDETTTFTLLNKSIFYKDERVRISPNPVRTSVHVKSDSAIESVQLFDIQGRLLQASPVNEVTATLDLSARQNGIYFLKIITEKGAAIEKVIKEN